VACDGASLAEALGSGEAPESATGTTALLQSAQGGTLYLDGVGELPHNLQAALLRLLRAMEDRRSSSLERTRWDARIIAASHRDLRTLAAIGQFHHDLYAMLSVIEIAVPPLRQRVEDIGQLAAHALRRIALRAGTEPKVLGDAALARMQCHTWPGNLHELKHMMTLAAAQAEGDTIELRHMGTLGEPPEPPEPPAKVERLHEVMHTHVLSVLTRCAGNKLRAAELLGISRSTLYRMLDAAPAGGRAIAE
jgi:DNA-binding NtrC family response regulator